MALRVFFFKVEEVGVWPDGLLDAYIATIPKTDGDATPCARGLVVYFLLFTAFGPLPERVSLRIGFGHGSLIRSTVLVAVAVRLRLGFPLPWVLRRF